MLRRGVHRRPVHLLALVAALLCACASVPKGQYAVESLSFEGMKQMDPEALSRCLLTTERASFELRLGIQSADCSEPPFDSSAPDLQLWSWPWTDWPPFNAAVLRVDKARVERWYQARGFYDARVVDVRVEPKAAVQMSPEEGDCDPEKELCKADITIIVEEGEPLRVGDIAIEGIDGIPTDLQKALREGEVVLPGTRFDEHDYNLSKEWLAERLAEGGYPDAHVSGEVRLDHPLKRANVQYKIEPGPRYHFGEVRVEGQDSLPVDPIVAAADVPKGEVFRQSMLTEVQQEVYALGAFSAVTVERELDGETHEAHIRIKVSPLDKHAFRIGVGLTSGAQQRTATGTYESVPQWDIHLSARYEQRHVFNTLGRLRVEEKPRLIYPQQFPGTTKLPRLGNLLSVQLNEPGLLEKRTDLIGSARWDLGPDPFLAFMRSDISLRLAATRAFFRPLFLGTVALEYDRLILMGSDFLNDLERPVDYRYTFLEQNVVMDLRNDDVQPRRGVYARAQATEALLVPGLSDWTMFGLQGDLRGYLPLPFGMVLAGRFAAAANFITDVSTRIPAASDFTTAPDLPAPPESRTLGPTAYRLRAGGAQSDRGYLAGEVGAGLAGGIRRWEASIELRIRLGESLAFVTFYDMANVTQSSGFGFGNSHPSIGGGLRYLTVIGALRFDVGFRLNGTDSVKSTVLLLNKPGAIHLTIGEAF